MANPKAAQESANDAKGIVNKEQGEGTKKTNNKEKCRHRASVACASCRDRRIRCVVPAGENECTQCKRSGIECIIRNDDERRRPISRAYMCSLTERVVMLESLLAEKGEQVPEANYPPMTRHGPRPDEPRSAAKDRKRHNKTMMGQQSHENSSPGSLNEEFFGFENIDGHSPICDDDDSPQSANSPSLLLPPKKDGIVSRLLSTRGHLSFDQLNGRLRYFGPTTNCHVHSGEPTALIGGSESLEQARRAEKTIRFLSDETYEYLMDLFWTFYNSVIHVMHKDAFEEDREQGRTQFYSGFLHICILANGFRFADKNRPDIQRLQTSKYESTLHREAKYMLDGELERPGGITSVIALLLLGDLECGVGRDNTGWLYAGMAVRVAFDIGLHLDTGSSCLSEREVEIRRMSLWAARIFDTYWALFLGRPTSMKSGDLEVSHLTKQFERLGTCLPAGPEKALETQIYEALLDLMELAGKITENMDSRSLSETNIDRDAYLRMATVDREFGSWYQRLPERLRWIPANIATAPYSFFLLHQQYHAALILLHRPFAMYEEPSSDGSDSGAAENHFSSLSRTVCTKHAIRVARIFFQCRQHFDMRQCFVTGLQHAGTAATALVAALAYIKDPADRANNMQYLDCLTSILQDLSHTYQPAERMFLVLQAVTAELRGISPTSAIDPPAFRRPAGKSVPARRPSTAMEDTESPSFTKRRHLARTASRTKTSRKHHRTDSFQLETHVDPSLSVAFSPTPTTINHARCRLPQDEQDRGFILIPPNRSPPSPGAYSSWHSLASDLPTPGTLPPNFLHAGLPSFPFSLPVSSAQDDLSLLSSGANVGTGMPGAAAGAAGEAMETCWTRLDSSADARIDLEHLASVHFPELRDWDFESARHRGGGEDMRLSGGGERGRARGTSSESASEESPASQQEKDEEQEGKAMGNGERCAIKVRNEQLDFMALDDGWKGSNWSEHASSAGEGLGTGGLDAFSLGGF